MGSSTYSAQVHSGSSNSKEGDSTRGPKPERAAKGAWPTLVIESGVSQTLGQLRICMRRWFSMSNHEVKIVMLTKFDGNKILFGEVGGRDTSSHWSYSNATLCYSSAPRAGA